MRIVTYRTPKQKVSTGVVVGESIIDIHEWISTHVEPSPSYLKPGDRLRLEVGGVGILEHSIA